MAEQYLLSVPLVISLGQDFFSREDELGLFLRLCICLQNPLQTNLGRVQIRIWPDISVVTPPPKCLDIVQVILNDQPLNVVQALAGVLVHLEQLLANLSGDLL